MSYIPCLTFRVQVFRVQSIGIALFKSLFSLSLLPISGIGVGRHNAKHGGKHLLKQLGGNVQNGRLEGLGCEVESETVDIGERLLNN